MKQRCTIELYAPGLVVFDPRVLQVFLADNGVTDSDVFAAFVQDPALGLRALQAGAVLPIYPIEEREYTVFLDGPDPACARPAQSAPDFAHGGFALKVLGGGVIVADLHALLDWDAAFFTRYRELYGQRLASNDYLDIAEGLYSVSVNGYASLPGYGLSVTPVQALPAVAPGAAVDDVDFSLP